jgi:hypothetical protein
MKKKSIQKLSIRKATLSNLNVHPGSQIQGGATGACGAGQLTIRFSCTLPCLTGNCITLRQPNCNTGA